VRPPRDIVLVSGKGTELSSDGLEVRATSTGRPLANRKGDRVQVYLVSQLLHPRDVDLTTGHLRFKGDVTVGGNVLEGMEVEALGKVEIGGSVTRARVEAGGSVRIGRGVLAGTVVAGGRWGHFRGVIPLMREVAGEASALGAALVQAGGTEAAAPPGVWMRALLESRWPRLTAKLEASIKALRSLPANLLGEEIPSLLGELKSILDSPLRLKDIEAFVRPAGELHSRVTELDALGQEKANIRCGYAVSSTLQATGDIHLTGDGGHSSRLLAGGSVRVERVFRGGEIEAGGDVWVGELGAPGIPARVKVVASASVRLAQVAEDSVIQVGHRVHRALDASRRVGLKLNREGELEFFW
ncbi:MAG TPA: DUF342 domain-containing protein, partial [Firmicutes bacterium]|nr:DUF342 domain-containing protein [Bacillota bacterium]